MAAGVFLAVKNIWVWHFQIGSISVLHLVERFDNKRMSGFLNVQKMSVCWRIPNFLNLPAEAVVSSKFFLSGGSSDDCKWWLECYPRGSNKEAEGFVSIYLSCSSDISVSYKISIVKKNHEKLTICAYDRLFKPNSTWGFLKFIQREELSNNPDLLPEGALNINCTITQDDIDVKLYFRHSKLTEQFKSMYLSAEHSDVSITVGKKVLPVHKFVLCARSPVFRAMFSHGMQEKCENQITISDIEEDAIEQMLMYIYSDDSPKLCDIPEDLFMAADKYSLDGLKEMCVRYMCRSLTTENACVRYLLSCNHDLKTLKSRIEDFAGANIKSIIESSAYTAINASHPDVMKQLILSYLEKQQNLTSSKP